MTRKSKEREQEQTERARKTKEQDQEQNSRLNELRKMTETDFRTKLTEELNKLSKTKNQKDLIER
jgi:hypothetical protein